MTPLSPAWWGDVARLVAATVILAVAAVVLRVAALADHLIPRRQP